MKQLLFVTSLIFLLGYALHRFWCELLDIDDALSGMEDWHHA